MFRDPFRKHWTHERRLRLTLWHAALMGFALALHLSADAPEQPVGLILSPGGSKLVRLSAETPLAARAGDLLFAGDTLRTESTPASFLFCPASALETLGPS